MSSAPGTVRRGCRTATGIEWLSLLAAGFALGCTPETVDPESGTGGSGSSSGGVTASGGVEPGTGGSPGTGGTSAAGGSSGGTVSIGGQATGGTSMGGAGTGGKATGGSATGGKATGGTATGGAATGGKATGGAATGGSGGPGPGNIFGQCRFHFGTIDSRARSNPTMLAQVDMFTSGWIGSGENFNLSGVCTQTNPGGAFAGKVPALVSYIIAFTARRDENLQDCNVSSGPNLCNSGATYIRAHLNDRIIPQYVKYAQGFASACGSRPMIWMMEPDYYQYTNTDPNRLTAAEAGQIMHTLVTTVKQYLPSALFSMDISPWIANNGANWFPNFTMSDFTFISTSGGGTAANNTRIRANNSMTWAGVHQVTGKPILADTGYGVAGTSAGHDAAWDVVANINARIADGVISITQYNPVSTWGDTIVSIRSQLSPVPCY